MTHRGCDKVGQVRTDMNMLTVHLKSFHPLPRTISLSLPASATISEVASGFCEAVSMPPQALRISARGRRCLYASNRLADLLPEDASMSQPHPVELSVYAPTLGGKGGFGSMLRAQGGKMSARRGEENNDSCRDLNGRRLSVMKEAKKLAAYLEAAPARQAALDEAQRLKYAKLEKMLGRKPKDSKDFEAAAKLMNDADEGFEGEDGEQDEAESSTQAAKRNVAQPDSKEDQSTGLKRKERIDDHEFVEQSREIVENVRSAVASAMMKKRKKAKTAASSSAKVAKSSVPA